MGMSLHEKVTQYIKEGIESGKYKVGDRIPTENELAAELCVSRPTVRQALGQLTSLGFLLRVKGRGTFVTKPKLLHQSTLFISSYRAESQKNGQRVDTTVLELCVEKMPNEVTKAFKLPIGSKGTKLVRLRRLEGYNNASPVVYTTLYVPYTLFPKMCELDFTELSFYETMDNNGLGIRHASRKLEVVSTPISIANSLNISPFEPTIFVTSIGKTEDHQAVEYSQSYYPAGCSSFIIEVSQ